MYPGIATDVSRRLAEHRDGKGAKYLRGKGPLRLVYEKVIGAKGLALSVEGRIKKLSKARKEALIEQDRMIEQVIAQAKEASDRRVERSAVRGSSSHDGASDVLTIREARRLALARAGLLKPEWTGFPRRAKGGGKRARDAAAAVIRRFGYLQLDTVSIDGSPHARTAQEEEQTRLVLESTGENPQEYVENRELGDQIEHAIGQLRPEYRTAVLLRHVEGYAYDEIAEIMDLPLGTVKTYLHRARGELKEMLAHLTS